MSKTNVAVVGCSHSSFLFGRPYHDYLDPDKYSVISSSSPGGGNEMFIDKLYHILSNNDIDVIVVQLTEPARLTQGIRDFNINYNKMSLPPNQMYHSDREFDDVLYYTFNIYDNNTYLSSLLNEDVKVDDFILKNISTTRYNLKVKIFHTLLSIIGLSKMFNTKLFVFSWFVEFDELLKQKNRENHYQGILDNIDYVVDKCVATYTHEKRIYGKPELDYHYSSDQHKDIFEGYFYPHFNKFINSL